MRINIIQQLICCHLLDLKIKLYEVFVFFIFYNCIVGAYTTTVIALSILIICISVAPEGFILRGQTSKIRLKFEHCFMLLIKKNNNNSTPLN